MSDDLAGVDGLLAETVVAANAADDAIFAETAPAGPARPGAHITLPRVLASLLLGLLVGAVGTAIHRTIWSAAGGANIAVGLILALALTLCVGLLVRAWAGLPALLALAVGWLLAVHGMSLTGPGGDVLVLDPSAPVPIAQAGVIWTYAGIALLVATAFLPRRWFAARPARPVDPVIEP